MIIKHGEGSTEHGTGIFIELTGDEVASAIDAWLAAHGACVNGPRTVTVNGKLCEVGKVYVDPSGSVKLFGRNPIVVPRELCSACGHARVFHQVGTGRIGMGNGVPKGTEFCDDRHADPCGCRKFV